MVNYLTTLPARINILFVQACSLQAHDRYGVAVDDHARKLGWVLTQ